MNWAAFPFLRIAIAFAAGIFTYEYFEFDILTAFLPFLIFAIFYIFGEYFFKPFFPKSFIQGLLLLIIIFFGGGLAIVLKKQDIAINIIENQSIKKIQLYVTIIEKLKSDNGAKLLSKVSFFKTSAGEIKHKNAFVILKFDEKDSLANGYKPGNKVLVNSLLKPIPKNTNPEAFDYAYYLKTKSIIQQGTVKINEHHLDIGASNNYILYLTGRASAYASDVLHKYIKEISALGVAQAILLGQKLLLTDDIYKSYSDTGAIHVLSVSGLHVAIFISVFIWLFSKIDFRTTVWIVIKISILLFLVWFYVILTGMSPSVIRAGTMISLYIIGKTVFSGTNSFNILSIAALVMLIYNPYSLFQASFQFSYISLISILYFQPKISNLWKPENKIMNFVWGLTNISFSAQILIFPLTTYYFHQFPVYFALSGIIAVPLVTLIIYIGTLLIVTESFFVVSKVILGPLLEAIIRILNFSVNGISQLPYSTISKIWISDFGLLLLFIALIFLIIWLETRSLNMLYMLLISLSLVVFERLYKGVIENQKSKLFVYDTYGGNVVDLMGGDSLITVLTGNVGIKTAQMSSANNRIKHKFYKNTIVNAKTDTVSYLYKINGKLVYINNESENPENLKNQNVSFLIVTKNKYNSPKLLLEKLHPETVVLDRNVPPWIEKKWLSLKHDNKFKLHNIKTDGAFEYNFNNLKK
jgi:competence protein ComEC